MLSLASVISKIQPLALETTKTMSMKCPNIKKKLALLFINLKITKKFLWFLKLVKYRLSSRIIDKMSFLYIIINKLVRKCK